MVDFENDQIKLITKWPGNGREEGKAPTKLSYKNGKVTWDYNIPAGAESVQWFKLLLLRDEDLEPEVRKSEPLLQARKYLQQNKKSAIDLIADYLRSLWKHTLETINRNRSQTVINALRFHVVITVPAIWKSRACWV